ncbi:MAG: SpoIID/LytB domain-containing protein [Deltaproteobacteria bacterium]|nr:SpoIID/LytB domain-containing protein [Deltaproteobacteria bacterium]
MRGKRSEVRGQRSEIGSRTGFYCLLLTVYCSLFFLSSCVRDTSTVFAQSGEKIRIAVLKGAKDLKIEGAGSAEADGYDLSTHLDKDISRTTFILALEESGALTVNNSKIAGPSITFSSETGILYLNNRPFRGKMEVLKDQKGLLAVNELPLEFYVAGLINHEISSKWPIEAVKAQAVIARTYALYQKKKRMAGAYHMESTVADQVYSGSVAEDDRSFYAVKETIGEVLTYNGEIALTAYHSNSGGITEDSKNIWGKDYPYLRQVKSLFDKDAPNFSWKLNISPQSVEAALNAAGYSVTDVQEIMPLSRANSGRVTKVRVRHAKGDMEISGEDLRKTLGYDKLKSAMFTVETIDGLFVFSGKGSGHGVGLSQWGAKGMAEEGYDYAGILEHFYPGTKIERIY